MAANNTVDSPKDRLLCLLYMLPYAVWELALGLAQLRDLAWTAKTRIRSPNTVVDSEVSTVLTRGLSFSRQQCERLELSISLDRIGVFSGRLRDGGLTIHQLGEELGFLSETMFSELKQRRFAFVPTERAKLLDNVERDWNQALSKFPSATGDIKAAIECYALDCNTACVFHSMRVAERGLRVLATALKVKTIGPQKHPLEFAQWGQILSALAGKLRAIQQSPGRSAKKAALTKFYGDAASQADYLLTIA
ncbi:MAG: hypothetical protein WA005_04500 [Candidatus Binataceae bacterium]